MTNSDDRDREIAELKAQVERLSAGKTAPPKVEVTGGPSSGGGFKGGFFGCLGVVAAIVVLLVALIALGQWGKSFTGSAVSSSSSGAGGATSAAPQAAANAADGAANSSAWTYSQEADALHDTKTKVACTTSTDQVHLDFPYHDTDARLCIRSGPRFGTDAFVQLNGDGQILCGIDSCTLHLRFDKGAVQNFPAVPAADNSSNIIFIRRTPALISKLRGSGTAVVELQLFQAGVQTLTFPTAGLKWP
jgi:hypothetical protein